MIPYPAYKSTNLPWLPNIPAHWDVVKIKYAFKERVEKGYPEEPLLAATQNHGVIPKSLYETRTVTAQKDLHLLKLVRVGDFVISLRSFQGGIEYAYYQGIISPAYTIMVPSAPQLNPMFFKHLAKSKTMIKLLQTCVTGIREGQNIDYETLKRNSIPVPPLNEQEQIVRYLDSMTAKINKLIRAKKKQIALLQEQRQAIINQAVTKGLDPNVEMKDSGQSRIGTIPRHWLLKEVKRMCRLQGGSGFPVEYQGNFSESIPFIKVNSLSSHISTLRQYDTVSPETAKLLNAKVFSQGDIVFAKVGAALLLHRFEILPFDCCIDNNMMAMYNISENVYWLKYALSLLNFNDLVNPGAVPSISQTQVGSLLIPCPPNSEQMEIVSHIERHSRKIDTLISRIEHSIICLQEYKNSLISSVVTGQTDVRNIPVEDVIPDDLIPDDDPTSEIEEEPTADESEE